MISELEGKIYEVQSDIAGKVEKNHSLEIEDELFENKK